MIVLSASLSRYRWELPILGCGLEIALPPLFIDPRKLFPISLEVAMIDYTSLASPVVPSQQGRKALGSHLLLQLQKSKLDAKLLAAEAKWPEILRNSRDIH